MKSLLLVLLALFACDQQSERCRRAGHRVVRENCHTESGMYCIVYNGAMCASWMLQTQEVCDEVCRDNAGNKVTFQ